MADIRIKDLTTEVSSTATGDFFVIDGTTGTRRTPAFNPTFGGNAVVTGTLTVNGTGTNSIPNLSVTGIGGLNVSANFLTSANTLRFSDSAAGGQTWFMSPQLGDGVATNFAFYSNDGVTSTPLFRVSSAGVFRLPSTAASTTTSSGALVVSGGVGVGGAITLGSSLTSTASDGKIVISGSGNTTGTKELQFVRADGGDSTVLGLAGSAYAGVLTGLGNNDAYLYTSSAYAFRIFVGTSSRYDFTSSQFKINPTTISNSTSSGALVVAGGVGVAGAINSGGTLRFHTNANLPGVGSMGISATYGLNMYASTGSSYDFTVFNAAGSSLILNPTGTQNLTLPGNVTIGGQLDLNSGTAAAPSLKLNGTNNGLFYNGSNIVRIAANGTLAASIGVAGSEFSGVLTAGSGTHTFGTSANSASVLVQRITTNPSAVSLNALVSFANIDFTSEGGGYTFGAIKSNGSEVLRIFNGNLAAITAVAGGGLAVGGGLNVSATTASTSTSSGALVVSGGVGVAGKVTSTALGLANTSQSISAWGDIGPQLSIAGAVVTDTTSSGTVSRAVANSINATAFAASSSTTYTQAVSLFIADAPTANTNVTITHRYALYTAGGRINFQGLPTSSAGLQAGTLWNDGGTLKVA